MKECEDTQKDLVELIFDELDEERAVALNQHMVSCQSCRREEERMLEMHGALKETAPAMDPALKERIRAALPKRPQGTVIRLFRRPVPAYAAVAAMLLVAILVRGGRKPDEVAQDARDAAVVPEASAFPFAVAGSYEMAPWIEAMWMSAESTPTLDPSPYGDSL